ncbi:MAG: sel1 repeat family protein [Candidatus Methanomethylophilaceae archaeon]|nr:sel1 repeat family protein [Candidatus Methanomethylophilaceae archaeon]
MVDERFCIGGGSIGSILNAEKPIGLHDFELAIWMMDDFNTDIVESVKRSNIPCVLVSNNEDVLKKVEESYSPFLKAFTKGTDSISSVLERYRLPPAYCIVVVDSEADTTDVIRDYSRIQICNEREMYDYINLRKVSRTTIEKTIGGRYDPGEYDRLIKEGNRKRVIRYLKDNIEDDEACIQLVRYLIENGSERDKKKAYNICCKSRPDSIPELKCILSDMYFNGIYVQRNLDESISLLEKTDLSKVPSYYRVLISRLKKRGNESDKKAVLEICEIGYHQDHSLLYEIALMYSKGDFLDRDLDKAIEYSLRAVDYNFGKSKNLATDLLIERGNEEDISEAFRICNNYSKEGNPWAQLRLARMYRDGRGVKKDEKKAAELFINAYRSGVNEAKQEMINALVKEQEWVKELNDIQDIKEDEEYKYQLAKEASKDASRLDEVISILEEIEGSNKSEAINLLIDSLLKRNNDGDKERAFELCESHSDNLWTRGRLSRMYRDGTVVEADIDKAIELMKEPAHYGINWARNEYVDMLNSRGKESDYKEAYYICLQGAFDEDLWSQIKLGRMYYNGVGVKKDVQNALILMSTAARKGNEIAKRELRRMKQEIKENQ